MPTSGFELFAEHRDIHAKLKPRVGSHILTGPVYVEDAEVGDVLEVHIIDVQLRQDWGWNLVRPLLGTLPEDFPTERLLHIPIDRRSRTAVLPWGKQIQLRPFFGIHTVAPRPEYGAVSSIIPREFGGNMDNKEFVPGTTIFFPIWVPGALFSVGDGHAVQGDGEVCLTALETALSGTFELVLRKDIRLRLPRAETPSHYITMGFDPDLDIAAKVALREMITLIGEVADLAPVDAYSLCSLAADLRVTQLVDGNKGIHAMLQKELLSY
jgi:acetamidase/formamidase